MNDTDILEEYAAKFWDLFKYAHNVRPRWVDTSTWTIAQFEDQFVILDKLIESNHKQQLILEGQAVEQFEIRIQTLLIAGAVDSDMAISWIHEAEDTGGDNEYLCYTLNLPYNYIKNKYNKSEYQGLSDNDGMPDEQQEWHDYDPDC